MHDNLLVTVLHAVKGTERDNIDGVRLRPLVGPQSSYLLAWEMEALVVNA
jgi:hypothetical protein